MTRTKVTNSSLAFDSGPLSGFRNAILNGNYDHWQRATSQSTSGYGSADRWINAYIGSTSTLSRQTFTVGQTDVPGDPTYFCRMAVTSVAGSGNYSLLAQRIEGVRTFAGQQVTVSFYAKADAAKNVSIEILQYFGTGGTPSATVLGIGVTKKSITTSWQKVTHTFTIPSISGKTIGTNNDDYITLNIYFDAGSSFNSRTDTLGQQSGTFDIAQVQIEAGPVATPFERRPIGIELILCQRYFEIISGTSSTPLGTGVGQCTSATTAFFQVGSLIPKRAVPVATLSAGNSFAVVNSVGSLVAGTAASILNYGTNSVTIQITVASGLTAGNSTNLYANTGGASIRLNSEL